MISDLRDYVMHLSAVALLCAIILRLARGSGAIKMMIKLLCGVILACSLIQPIKELRLSDFEKIALEFREDADQAVQWGKIVTSEAWAESISQGVEAYILEKAKTLNLDVDVEVELSPDEIPVPVGVSIIGNIAPYAKTVLSDTIEQNLQIPKEKQVWISS